MISRDEIDKTNLVAVLAAAVDLARNGDDLVAVLVVLTASAEADVKPSALEDKMRDRISTHDRLTDVVVKTYTASAGPLLETRRGRRGGSNNGDDESEDEGKNGKARHDGERVRRTARNDRWCASRM